MLEAFPIFIPDEVLDFKGSATELAELCNRLLRENKVDQDNLEGERDPANERLIRHYVHVDVLTPPVRQGRDAVYGARQAAEFVIARKLLSDGWPLAKIAELIKSYDLPIPALAEGEPELPTEAERVIARIHAAKGPGKVMERPHVARRKSMPEPTRSAPMSMPDSLGQAAALSARRMDLAETLRALGNESGAVEREEMVRIRLTPWATVDVDARQLRRLGPAAAEALGKALAEALRQEQVSGGDKR
jgi:DNA-binding transcriptional MerR regulator